MFDLKCHGHKQTCLKHFYSNLMTRINSTVWFLLLAKFVEVVDFDLLLHFFLDCNWLKGMNVKYYIILSASFPTDKMMVSKLTPKLPIATSIIFNCRKYSMTSMIMAFSYSTEKIHWLFLQLFLNLQTFFVS